MSRSRQKERRQLLIAAMQCDEFPWDYSYFKWQDIPVEVRRQKVMDASRWGRCWIQGRTGTMIDVHLRDARRLYNRNKDGCRDLWKECYWQRKLFKNIDRPIKARDPRSIKYERQYRERREAEHAAFNALQQEVYQTWLRLKGRPCS